MYKTLSKSHESSVTQKYKVSDFICDTSGGCNKFSLVIYNYTSKNLPYSIKLMHGDIKSPTSGIIAPSDHTEIFFEGTLPLWDTKGVHLLCNIGNNAGYITMWQDYCVGTAGDISIVNELDSSKYQYTSQINKGNYGPPNSWGGCVTLYVYNTGKYGCCSAGSFDKYIKKDKCNYHTYRELYLTI